MVKPHANPSTARTKTTQAGGVKSQKGIPGKSAASLKKRGAPNLIRGDRKKPGGGAAKGGAIEVLALSVVLRDVGKLKANPRNANRHPEEQVKQLAAAYREYGFTGVVLIDQADVIIAGEGRWRAAQLAGMKQVPCVVAQGWSDQKIRAYMLADNQLARNSVWDSQLLADELGALSNLGIDPGSLGFSPAQLTKALRQGGYGKTDPDDAPEMQPDAVSRPGDIWHLGPHRVGCIDSTNTDDVKRLLSGAKIDVLLQDPPYCSGGFQEASRRSGSIGTRGDATIANDTLSTRGYQALMKAVLERWGAGSCYIFTDWRMWISLFDVVESSGYGVRNMVVWDKGTPGMGRGWRMQHELIMAATRVKQPFDPKQAQGNVVQSKRTGNLLHPTQKPVDLIRTVLAVTDFAQTVADPFLGSGSTLIASHELGRKFYGCDLDPLFVDVSVRRWQEFTGQEAVLVRDKTQRLTFAETEAQAAG